MTSIHAVKEASSAMSILFGGSDKQMIRLVRHQTISPTLLRPNALSRGAFGKSMGAVRYLYSWLSQISIESSSKYRRTFRCLVVTRYEVYLRILSLLLLMLKFTD